MENQLKVLYGHWVDSGRHPPDIRRSWKRIDRAVAQAVPEGQQETFTARLEEHCSKVEYQGFVAGFRVAMEIWKAIM